jgi:tetratricopeptide (TPR) repeat protein
MARRHSLDVPVSAGSAAAVAAYDAALASFLPCRGDPLAAIEPVLAEDPEFVMGHALRAGLAVAAWDKGALPLLRRSMGAVLPLAASANARERAHLAAARAWLAGEYRQAADQYAACVREWPGDLLALRLAQACYFFIGHTPGLLESVRQALPHWRPGTPGYEHVLAMHAFALAENGEPARAEDAGRAALAIRPHHPYAIHAVAHALLEQGRAVEGARWLESAAADWATDSGLAGHLWWHAALFHLEAGRIDRTLELYDARFAPRAGAVAIDAADASALLWRLELEGVDVGPRWNAIASLWAPRAADALWPLLDLHAMMAFAAAGRDAEARSLGAFLEAAARGRGENAAAVRDVGLPVARAIQAFAREQYGRAVELLVPVRTALQRLGGSRAQREALELTALEAAIRAGRGKVARELAAARATTAPATPRSRMQAARAAFAFAA